MPPKSKPYDGPVVFSQGVHYPADKDGHADLTRPLRVNDDGTYRSAEDDEPLHNEVHHLADAELAPGSEDES